MIQEIMDMVKLFDQQQNPDGGEGRHDKQRPSLEELLAFLHQANGATNPAALQERQAVDQRLREAAAAGGFASNFEEIIAQHIAYNGTARQQQVLLQHQQSKRKQSKRAGQQAAVASAAAAMPSSVAARIPALMQALRSAKGAIPDELVHEVFTDDEGAVALLRSLGPVEGVSVELHCLNDDERAPTGGSGKKGTAATTSSSGSGSKGTKGKGAEPSPIAVPASSPAPAAAAGSDGKKSATASSAQLRGSNTDALQDADGDDELDEIMDGEDVVVHEDDLQQINHMIMALEPLSESTLEALSAEWDVAFPNGSSMEGAHLLYRTNITERIRYLSATMVVGVADRFQVLQNNHPNTQDAEQERMMLVNNLVLSLWHGIHVLTENVRKNFAVIFGLEADSTAHDVCVAVIGLGIAAFFEPLPLPLLEKVHSELGLTPVDTTKVDPDLVHEVIAHKICAHFYPALGNLPDMNLRCTTQLTVHENGPGSYTCTIDNALLMDLVIRQVHVSNKFSCQKVKWRARVEVRDGSLSFFVWHHDPKTFQVHLALRTSEKGKKKKAGDDAAATGGLYLEKKDTAAPDCPVGFQNIVQLQQVYRNLTTSANGLRLYNRAEDRVIFQFSMEVTVAAEKVDGDGLTAAAAAKAQGGKGNAKATTSGGGGATNGNAPQATNADAVGTAGQTIAELIEQEEREKKEKQAAKTKQKIDKRFKQLEQSESQARDQIVSQCSVAASQIHAEAQKSLQKAVQKKKDRERKQDLAKATPSTELLAQLSVVEQAVRAARQAHAKLVAEKNKEEKEVSTLRSRLEGQTEELEQLQKQSEENTAVLANLEQEILDTEERIESKRKALEAKKERRARRKPSNGASGSTGQSGMGAVVAPFGSDESGTSSQTLSIKDFQSFWNISATTVPTSSSSPSGSGGGGGGGAVGGMSVQGSPLPHPSAMMQSIGSGMGPSSSTPGGALGSGMTNSALSMGLDLGSMGPFSVPSMSNTGPSPAQQHFTAMGGGGMGPGHSGRMGPPPSGPPFTLNGDAQPFYGSTYVDPASFGPQKPLTPLVGGGGPSVGGARPMPLPFTASSSGPGVAGGGGGVGGPAGGVPTAVTPFGPPGGFSPYGVGQMAMRMPPASPGAGSGNSPLMHTGGHMMGGPHHRGPATPGQPYPPPPARQMYGRGVGNGFGFDGSGGMTF